MFIAVLCEEYLQCTKVFITILCRGLLAAYNSADYRAGHPLVEPVAGRPAAGRELEQQQGQRQAGHRQHLGADQAASAHGSPSTCTPQITGAF